MTAREQTSRWQWRLRSKPEHLWPMVADTQLLNQLAGLPPITLREETGPDGTRQRIGRTMVYGFQARWIEHPFEWLEGQEYSIERSFPRGPLEALRIRVHLEQSGTGSRVDVSLRTTARDPVGRALAVVVQRAARAGYDRALRRIDDSLQGAGPLPWLVSSPLSSGTARARLDGIRERLEGEFAPALVGQLCGYLEQAPDDEVVAMRPYRLADRWGTDRHQTLELFLSATRAGLLEMRWVLLCPLCLGPADAVARLEDLHHEVHCDACLIQFDADFDRSVELRFSVHPAIRATHIQLFCSGGPERTPHIVAQQLLEPGERRTLELALPPDAYRLRCLGRDPLTRLEVVPEGGERRLTVRLDADGSSPQPPRLSAGSQALVLVNDSGRQQRVVLEHIAWATGAVTAAEVTSLQHYRDLFSSEVLRPGQQFAVRSLAFLFTDLRHSSQLYQRLGDSAAYALVRDHFQILIDCIRAGHGGVVRTMGDAVMAVFPDPADALRTAVSMQRKLAGFRGGDPEDPLLTIRVGLHVGPCIAVNANDVLDFFGSTVNFAARMETMGLGGDVVLSEAFQADPGVLQWLEAQGMALEPFTAQVKGFTQNYRLFRLWPGQPSVAEPMERT